MKKVTGAPGIDDSPRHWAGMPDAHPRLSALVAASPREGLQLPQGFAQLLVFEDRLEPLKVLLVSLRIDAAIIGAAILPKPLG